MRQIVVGAWLALLTSFSWALSPYLAGDKQAAGDVKAQIAQVERKLQAEGFIVVAIHSMPGSICTMTGIGTGIGIAGLASGLMAMPLKSLRSNCRP